MNNVMQSWYARNIATTGLSSKENPPSLHQHEVRGSFNYNRPHRTTSTLSNTHTMNSSNISQSQKYIVGKPNFNPYIGTGAANKAHPCRVAAPTKIVNCDRDHIPMSQLTSPFELIANANHFSQDNCGRQRMRTRSALDGTMEHSRGIAPFNSNRSEVDLSKSSTISSHIQNVSERNSFPSCVSQRTEPESRLLHPSQSSYLAQESKTSHGGQSSIHSAPTNSQNTSQTSGYSNQFLSNDSSQCGIPQFQVKKHDFSQSNCPLSNTQKHYDVKDDLLHAMIDEHIRAVVNQRLLPELKELDNRQLSFYRRISEADEKHVECIKVVDRKHAACIEQIKALDKRSSNIDQQFVNVTKTIAKRSIEMEKQVAEFHKKGLYLENLYHKVTEMLKSIESSTKNFNEIVANSISSIKHAHETVMESTLPFIKQKASDIMTSLVAALGLNRNDYMEVISESEDEELNALSTKHLSVPTRSKGLRKSQEKNSCNDKAKNTEFIVRSPEENKGLKNTPVQRSQLSPLKFTKVRNDAYKQPSSAKVSKEFVVLSGRLEKSSKLAQPGIGKCRSPNATSPGNSMKQETPFKRTFSCPTVQGSLTNNSTLTSVSNETIMHPLLPGTTSMELLSPAGNVVKTSKHAEAYERKSRSPTIPLKGTSSFRAVHLNRPNNDTTPRPSKVVSPFASVTKHVDSVMIYTPLPVLPTDAHSQTRNRNQVANGFSKRPVCSPSRKRKNPEKKSMKKRMRSRYGHVNTMFDDDELEYGFLST